MDAQREFETWLNHAQLPDDVRNELEHLKGNPDAVNDCFGKTLEFGTGGMRGLMGVGPNRLNIFTIRRATFALAQFLMQTVADAKTRGVAIGYDCRHHSRTFAQEAGLTLAALGIRAMVAPVLCPTPEVSFAIRHLRAAGGIMITASHNPPQYNGYKAYGPAGYQLLPEDTNRIHELMMQQEDVFALPTLPLADAEQKGLFQWWDNALTERYVRSVVQSVASPAVTSEDRRNLTVVYTPLHGAGNRPVRQALEQAGYKHVHVVAEQEQPDGDFPTVKSPNPEEHSALRLGIEAARARDADLVLGTDPDSDRAGIAVRTRHGTYELLSGNQVGALLIDFLLSRRKETRTLPANGVVFKTVVTSDLGAVIAASYGVAAENVLTGFKYIGHGATVYEQTGAHTFLFGFEESYGYLISPIVRDKDAVQACLAIADMAAWYKRRGATLIDALHHLFARHGWFAERLVTVPLNAGEGAKEVERVMDGLRKQVPTVPDLNLSAVEDYLTSERRTLGKRSGQDAVDPLSLPRSNVLKYIFEDESWMAIRPSGTEPKIKVYLAARGVNETECETKLQVMQDAMERHLQ
ncbi:phosphoglucomutase [Alicyclobacillus contaminans]|uniref:phospho-sugar mutase n=1 Tax=Alicyclobacillus contaminans TaxID=392016 RepID=UPI00047C078F|nr:phospho-sugar mutase [Alicyclobacillus contaminans]GMA49811.1 phosphoglucomutase [Alicyclobacillus contaminans]